MYDGIKPRCVNDGQARVLKLTRIDEFKVVVVVQEKESNAHGRQV